MEVMANTRRLHGLENSRCASRFWMALGFIVSTAHNKLLGALPDLRPSRGQPGWTRAGIDRLLPSRPGKGGVGKSTASNLACALTEGRRVGLLDADVYGLPAK
jgi:hypothetical protein